MLASYRGWMIPAYSLPPDAQEEVVMRALVKENVSHAAARTLHEDVARACRALEKRGGVHEARRRNVKTGTRY